MGPGTACPEEAACPRDVEALLPTGGRSLRPEPHSRLRPPPQHPRRPDPETPAPRDQTLRPRSPQTPGDQILRPRPAPQRPDPETPPRAPVPGPLPPRDRAPGSPSAPRCRLCVNPRRPPSQRQAIGAEAAAVVGVDGEPPGVRARPQDPATRASDGSLRASRRGAELCPGKEAGLVLEERACTLQGLCPFPGIRGGSGATLWPVVPGWPRLGPRRASRA